jgi:recombinational DNA repair ATPase RecF
MSSNKIAIYGVLGLGVVSAAAVAIYYLAHEKEAILIRYDPKVHTRELLIELLLEFEIEYASLYLHWYHMLKQKEKEVGKNKIPEETMAAVREQIQKLTDDVDAEIIEKFKYSQSFFDEWVGKYQNDREIKNLGESLESNFQKLMKIEKPTFNFTFPKELTKQSYIKFIKVAYAKFRYDIYNEIQGYLRMSGKTSISDDEFNDFIKK